MVAGFSGILYVKRDDFAVLGEESIKCSIAVSPVARDSDAPLRGNIFPLTLRLNEKRTNRGFRVQRRTDQGYTRLDRCVHRRNEW